MSEKAPLELSSEEVAAKLAEARDMDELQRLTQLFNINQAKRDALRVLKLNDILNKLDDQVSERVEKHPDQFSNADLLNYVNAVQQSINKSSQSVNGLSQTPLIQLNQQNNVVNVGGEELTRKSREKVLETVRQFLNLSEKSLEAVDVEDVNGVYYGEGDDGQ